MRIGSKFSRLTGLRRSFSIGLGLLMVGALISCATQQPSSPPTQIRVVTSGAFTEAYKELVPLFEKKTGHQVISAFGASMGNAPDAIPSRIARGEPIDLIILAGPALDQLIQQGKAVAGTRVDIVRSSIGFAVKSGSPKPDISTVDKLKQALLNAKSIAYSASASGTYFATELVQKLGIADQVLPKSKRILSERVGTIVARGEAELGLQQVSELVPIKGIDYIGPLPAEVQQNTLFSSGIVTGAKEPQAAMELVRFLTSAASAPIISKTGLDPMPSK